MTVARRDPEAEPWLRALGRTRNVSREEDPIVGHLLLAVEIAGQFLGRGLSYADLIGEANLALVEAARRYPHSKAKALGVDFTSFAATNIRSHLLKAVRKAAPLHVGRDSWRDMWQCIHPDRAGKSDEEIAAELGFPVEKVRELRQLAQALLDVHSWDEPVFDELDDESRTLAEVTPDPDQDVEQKVLGAMEREELRQKVAKLVAELPPMSRLAISLSFGIEVPETSVVPFDHVLRASIAHNRDTGLERLRRRVRSRDGGAVVREGRSGVVHLAYSPLRPGSQARIRRDQVTWRRIASEPPPKALVAS